MASHDYSSLLLTGFVNNLLVTVLAAIIPAGVGIGLTFLMKAVDQRGLRIPLRVIGAVFYSLAPTALLTFLYFCVMATARSQMVPVILTLMISHLGFFPMFFDAGASAGKNIVVNLIGLFASLFMWSTISSLIGYHDIVYVGTMARQSTFDAKYCVIVLLITFVFLAVLNVARMILKEVMK